MNTEWLKVATKGRPIEVDRENGVLRGFVVAQEGPFKSEGRGEFDTKSLKSIVKLMKEAPKGLKSRFTHPDLSNDGLGKLLGRARDPFLDQVELGRDGQQVSVTAVRADLHFNPTAYKTPSGDLATYVMELAESDSDALSSSLVLTYDDEVRLEKDGTRMKDENGEPLPPLWRPLKLHATDIVDMGDAVDGLLCASLSADGLPDEVVRKAAALFKHQFGGKPRDFVEPRLRSWCDRVLDHYFGDDIVGDDEDAMSAEPVDFKQLRRRRLELKMKTA